MPPTRPSKGTFSKLINNISCIPKKYNSGSSSSSSNNNNNNNNAVPPRNSLKGKEPATLTPHDAYPQDTYSQNGYPQNTYPQNTYPQNTYPQNTYPQNTYPQNTYPQNTYPQNTYPQNTYPQNTYPQNTYPQHTYPQNTYPQNTYPQNTYPQNTYPQNTYPQNTYSQNTNAQYTYLETPYASYNDTVFTTKQQSSRPSSTLGDFSSTYPYPTPAQREPLLPSQDDNNDEDEDITDGRTCPECSKTFSRARDVKRHMNSHGPPKFECIFCKRRFHRHDVLLKHMCNNSCMATFIRLDDSEYEAR